MTAHDQASTVWCCSKCGAIYRTEFPRCPSDGAEVIETDRDPLIGMAIDRYTISHLLGEGGMGRVYAAYVTSAPSQRFAIKVLLGDLATSTAARRRFLGEAQHARGLAHPNTVRVLSHGETPLGLLYIVMELVDGTPLEDILAAGPMDPLRVVRLARDICAGLSQAHSLGIIHRDLKPSNVLVVAERGAEMAKIVDFGLARTMDADAPRITTTGMVMGSPAYIAPELTLGHAPAPAADLYGLGVTMFEALTGGRLPFEGSSIEIATAKCKGPAPPMSAVAPDVSVPRSVQDLVAKLVERTPDARFQSADDVIAELDRISSELSRVQWFGLRAPSKRVWLGSLVAAAVIAAGIVTVVGIRSLGGEEKSPPPVVAQVEPPKPGVPHPITGHEPPKSGVPHPITGHEPPKPGVPHPKTGHEPPARSPRVERRTARPANVAAKAPAPVVATPLAPPPVMPQPPPPPPPAPLRLAVSGLAVHGALTAADVDRAIDRLRTSLARCAPIQAQSIDVSFIVDANRRAKGVRTSGGSAATNACVAQVIATARTQEAPDVGDARVSLRVAYVKTP